jgi:CDP-glycerol glycerophosphotransferase
MDRYVEAAVIGPHQAVLVGYPKIDDLVNRAWPAAAVRISLALAPSLPTVLYAPTFSPASSLHLAGPAIIRALLDTGANVIVKLHDRSAVPHPRHTAGIDWPATLGEFTTNPRFALARSADAGPFLSAADLLVTDHSSVGFEFALLDRPVIVFDSPGLRDAARIDLAQWELLRSMADVVVRPDELPDRVRAALRDPSRQRQARARAQELFAFPGSATERALSVVYELLDVGAPGALASSLPQSTKWGTEARI